MYVVYMARQKGGLGLGLELELDIFSWGNILFM